MSEYQRLPPEQPRLAVELRPATRTAAGIIGVLSLIVTPVVAGAVLLEEHLPAYGILAVLATSCMLLSNGWTFLTAAETGCDTASHPTRAQDIVMGGGMWTVMAAGVWACLAGSDAVEWWQLLWLVPLMSFQPIGRFVRRLTMPARTSGETPR